MNFPEEEGLSDEDFEYYPRYYFWFHTSLGYRDSGHHWIISIGGNWFCIRLFE